MPVTLSVQTRFCSDMTCFWPVKSTLTITVNPATLLNDDASVFGNIKGVPYDYQIWRKLNFSLKMTGQHARQAKDLSGQQLLPKSDRTLSVDRQFFRTVKISILFVNSCLRLNTLFLSKMFCCSTSTFLSKNNVQTTYDDREPFVSLMHPYLALLANHRSGQQIVRRNFLKLNQRETCLLIASLREARTLIRTTSQN